jgi:hypothetical protein
VRWNFDRAGIPLQVVRWIKIPLQRLRWFPQAFVRNKTGTFQMAMLYVDNLGIAGLAGSVSV